MTGVTLLGLGPGDPGKITREAWDVLAGAGEVWLRTKAHPTVATLPPALRQHSFDEEYANGTSFEEVYASIIDRIIELAGREEGVVYAVPGDPFVAEATCPEIARRAKEAGIPCRVIPGVSFLEAAFAALGIDPFPKINLQDAMTLGQAHVPAFPPDVPTLVSQVYSRVVAAEVKAVLGEVYPDEHPVRLVHAGGTAEQVVEELALYEIDRSEKTGGLTCLYVPALDEGTSLESLQEVVARLRAPDGCPWDREQTHESLRSHLLEEGYEALTAMDANDFASMREEFGDLLLQIMLNAQIANEEGEFSINDVIKGIRDKIVRRHPHVFGDVKVAGVDGVLANWERLKETEREAKNGEGGLLEGVPLALPALTQAQELQDRARRVGFDWPEIEGVLDKIAEEISEVRQASDPERLSAELGDLFFALVNLARWKDIDAEAALRGTNAKFRRRFAYIERGAKADNRSLSDLSLAEMETFWQKAKTEDR